MLIKGDPGGAKSLPEQNVDSNQSQRISQKMCKLCWQKLSFEIHILDSFMNLPCDNELTARLITVLAFRSGLSELTHIP